MQVDRRRTLKFLLDKIGDHLKDKEIQDDVCVIYSKTKWDREAKISLFCDDEHVLLLETFVPFYDSSEFHMKFYIQDFQEILREEDDDNNI